MPSSLVLVLIAGGIALAAVAVVVDRLNFPQRRFVPKQIPVDESSEASRDRTGAHIVDLGDEERSPNHPPRSGD
jgi:hypothetical protein